MNNLYYKTDTKSGAFLKFCDKYIPLVDKNISDFFKEKIKKSQYRFISQQYAILEKYCLRPGKRIRPLLVILSYIGYGGNKKNQKEIIKIASSIEIAHVFLLIQDDIIDKSEYRRGDKSLHVLIHEQFSKKSKNKNIGNDIALILADVLLFNTIEIIAKSKINPASKSNFLKLFADTYEMTAWGQVLDILNTLSTDKNTEINSPELIGILKTAFYTICNPILMGMLLAGKSNKNEIKKIKDFSIPIGLAFQIRDDILGVFGSKNKTGKSSKSDISEGKKTFLIHDTIKNIDKSDLKKFNAIFYKTEKSAPEIKFIKDKIMESGALDLSKNKLCKLLDDAERKLKTLKINNKEKDILSDIMKLISKV